MANKLNELIDKINNDYDAFGIVKSLIYNEDLSMDTIPGNFLEREFIDYDRNKITVNNATHQVEFEDGKKMSVGEFLAETIKNHQPIWPWKRTDDKIAALIEKHIAEKSYDMTYRSDIHKFDEQRTMAEYAGYEVSDISTSKDYGYIYKNSRYPNQYLEIEATGWHLHAKDGTTLRSGSSTMSLYEFLAPNLPKKYRSSDSKLPSEELFMDLSFPLQKRINANYVNEQYQKKQQLLKDYGFVKSSQQVNGNDYYFTRDNIQVQMNPKTTFWTMYVNDKMIEILKPEANKLEETLKAYAYPVAKVSHKEKEASCLKADTPKIDPAIEQPTPKYTQPMNLFGEPNQEQEKSSASLPAEFDPVHMTLSQSHHQTERKFASLPDDMIEKYITKTPIPDQKYAILKGLNFTAFDQRTNQTLSRIVALKDIKDEQGNILARKGELGGWVAGHHNLSQEGNCWICPNGRVAGEAKISSNAVVSDFGVVSGDAKVTDNAVVKGHAEVQGHAIISGDAVVAGNARVSETAMVSGNSLVEGRSYIKHHTIIAGDTIVTGNTLLDDYTVYEGGVIKDSKFMDNPAELNNQSIKR